MSTEANTELVRRYLDAFNRRDREAMTDILADDVVEHGPHETLRGVDEILEFLDVHFEAFPDYAGRTDHVVAQDDKVVVRYTVNGTHSGTYQGIEPTGHTVEWTGLVMYRIDDDEIAEIWLEADRLGLLEQLEAFDPPAHLRV
ncbi:ester cyclase [Halomicroarcula sp. F13]|uniref:Ester cyclase n=1 Tax=Haloarcula rubra TaxID=2487747 RepID=A0AAW4PVC2_9EURY|nr:ester cyclase [Halomicroarcula rubra]MBX0324089.1 ester cyclase [Halomicroarcula rubra]